VQEKLERLAAAGIQLLPAELPTHFLFERDGFVALVERRGEAFGAIGTPSLLMDSGLAVLVWRGDLPYFVGKGHESPATEEQVEALRGFASDLEAALA
jgi:hypothetical protein